MKAPLNFSHLEQNGVKPVILSDNFVPIVQTILEANQISGIDIHANDLLMIKDRLIPSFPYYNPQCPSCAHCKKVHLIGKAFDGAVIYIGDGRSDYCPASVSDLVFAKDSLADHLKRNDQQFVPYRGLKDVLVYFRESDDLRLSLESR